MEDVKDKKIMHAIPMPTNNPKPKQLFQAEISLELFTAVKGEAKRRGIKLREVATWGLESFLLNTNPALAKKLGINNK